MVTVDDLLNDVFIEEFDSRGDPYYYWGPDDKIKFTSGKPALYLRHFESMFGPWRKFDEPSLNIQTVQNLKDILYDYYDERIKANNKIILKLQKENEEYENIVC